jgi:hypothetical protein
MSQFSIRVYGESGRLLRSENRDDRSQAVMCGVMWQRPESSHRIEVVWHPGQDGCSDRLIEKMERADQGWTWVSY